MSSHLQSLINLRLYPWQESRLLSSPLNTKRRNSRPQEKVGYLPSQKNTGFLGKGSCIYFPENNILAMPAQAGILQAEPQFPFIIA